MIEELVIEEKKCVIFPKIEYEEIIKNKLYFQFKERIFSIDEARKKSEDLILKWVKQK